MAWSSPLPPAVVAFFVLAGDVVDCVTDPKHIEQLDEVGLLSVFGVDRVATFLNRLLGISFNTPRPSPPLRYLTPPSLPPTHAHRHANFVFDLFYDELDELRAREAASGITELRATRIQHRTREAPQLDCPAPAGGHDETRSVTSARRAAVAYLRRGSTQPQHLPHLPAVQLPATDVGQFMAEKYRRVDDLHEAESVCKSLYANLDSGVGSTVSILLTGSVALVFKPHLASIRAKASSLRNISIPDMLIVHSCVCMSGVHAGNASQRDGEVFFLAIKRGLKRWFDAVAAGDKRAGDGDDDDGQAYDHYGLPVPQKGGWGGTPARRATRQLDGKDAHSHEVQLAPSLPPLRLASPAGSGLFPPGFVPPAQTGISLPSAQLRSLGWHGPPVGFGQPRDLPRNAPGGPPGTKRQRDSEYLEGDPRAESGGPSGVRSRRCSLPPEIGFAVWGAQMHCKPGRSGS
ncbi:hypothetical protein T492DRAFT_836739 [Pavlovales sp. CCMP2436]|nr:hypothetical protein T492DRAFT_836739 [Pavlovales sp. CCMP2436]